MAIYFRSNSNENCAHIIKIIFDTNILVYVVHWVEKFFGEWNKIQAFYSFGHRIFFEYPIKLRQKKSNVLGYKKIVVEFFLSSLSSWCGVKCNQKCYASSNKVCLCVYCYEYNADVGVIFFPNFYGIGMD